jgi:hypothetical protein
MTGSIGGVFEGDVDAKATTAPAWSEQVRGEAR